MMQRKKFWNGSRPSGIRLACFLAASMVLPGTLSFAQDTVTVVNGASYRPEQPVAAGSWVFGLGNFANVGQAFNFQLPLPVTLGGVTVTVNGVKAPLSYVSAAQINFVIPYGLAPGLHPVVVSGPSGVNNGTVRVINAAPGLFTLDSATPPQGAILNEDNSFNGIHRPAIRGQVIKIFATGHGALKQEIVDGTPAPLPAVETEAKPQVFVGGVECTVEFSGLTPGFVALWQINVRLPQLPFLAGKLPVQVFMNGVDSNEVSIYVAQ